MYQETLFSKDGCVLQERCGALFILLYGRYWVERQLHAGKLVVLVFHAKGELQRPPGGAGQPRDVANWPLPLCGRSGSPPEVGGSCVASTMTIRGRPASPRPADLALARLGLLLLWHVALKAHIASQVELGSESSGYLWIWAQLHLVQASRS